MKNALLLLILSFLSFQIKAQTNNHDGALKKQMVAAACGPCQFQMPGETCVLAVKINNIAYLVDGTGINDHGDAHSKKGFCNAVRKAEVTGKIVNGRFQAESFKAKGVIKKH